MKVELPTFENSTGEGVVSFEPWRTQGPEYMEGNSRFYCHLTIRGERIFEYGSPCGTCGIVFKKVGSVKDRISDSEAVGLLGDLDAVPSNDVLRKLARVLERGVYYPAVIEGLAHLTQPGAPDDYFATDVVRLFGLEPPEYKSPQNPRTAYYRLGQNGSLDKDNWLGKPYRALVTALVMPLHEPSELNRERIEYWKKQKETGKNLTALAVSVLDKQMPTVFKATADKDYVYKEHLLFANCIIDGHHRIQAAAELGVPVRILSLLSKDFSLTHKPDEIKSVLKGYARSMPWWKFL